LRDNLSYHLLCIIEAGSCLWDEIVNIGSIEELKKKVLETSIELFLDWELLEGVCHQGKKSIFVSNLLRYWAEFWGWFSASCNL